MLLRKYHPNDLPAITKLFHDTVHSVNSKDYSPEQINAWAPTNKQYDKWDKSFQDNYTIVAYDDEILTGFADISDSSYLNRLYVHSDYQKKGIATAICDMLETHAKSNRINKIITHASITAKPFFEKRQYITIREQTLERAGILLTNYIMEKQL